MADDTTAPPKGERIAKRLARAGICSRREAEALIEAGRVQVDGVRLTSPAVNVTEASRILVDGKPVAAPERTRLWRYHKPVGLIVSTSDPEGRPTVFAALPRTLPRVVAVGRLDLNSEGLLLLTNDGALARKLELPATGWTRRYRVRVHGTVDPDALARLENGVTVDGVSYGPIRARLDRQQRSNAWLTVSLQEGRNREVRKVMAHLGLGVTRLIRVSYGPYHLGGLKEGAVEEVPAHTLTLQFGDKEAAAAARAGWAKAKPRVLPPHKKRRAEGQDRRGGPAKGGRHAADRRR